MKRLARKLAMIGMLGLTITGCTTTYTEAELRKEESREDADARAEEVRDHEIGEEGGANREAIGEEGEWVDRESDL